MDKILSLVVLIIFISIVSCEEILEITLPNVTTSIEDEYICTWKQMDNVEKYVIKFEVVNLMNVHHMLIFKCKKGKSNDLNYSRKCFIPCFNSEILFVWAHNASKNELPKDVGFRIFPSEYLFVQVHFTEIQTTPSNAGIRLTLTKEVQKYMAGVLATVGLDSLPPRREQVLVNVSCEYSAPITIYPFAYRTHTHTYGRVVSGYVYNGTWNLVGKSNPQWPNAFWPTETKIVIKPRDKLFSICRYDTTTAEHEIVMGSSHNNEMCNFYIMYYYESNFAVELQQNCLGNRFPLYFDDYPKEGYSLLPRRASFEMPGEGMQTDHHNHEHGDDIAVRNNTIVDDKMKDSVALCPTYDLVPSWPDLKKLNFRQVSAVAIQTNGNVFIFHRGNVVWDLTSFDRQDNFLHVERGPIREDTITEIDSKTGGFVRSFGANFFYMPHGLHIDVNGSFWFTDVAMHQIFKFSANSDANNFKPLITIGKLFKHGTSVDTFCKPADVAVLRNGNFFVADGYCNRRVLHFDYRGLFIAKHEFVSSIVIHSLVVDEANDILYVADRHNSRILKFNWMTKITESIEQTSFKPEVFAVAYSPNLEKLFVINGWMKVITSVITIIDAKSLNLCGSISGRDGNPILNAHDMQVTEDGSYIYVAELSANGVKKFKMRQSVKKPGLEYDATGGNGSFIGATGDNGMKHPNSHSDLNGNEWDKKVDLEAEREHYLVVVGSLIIGCLLFVPLLIIVLIVCFVRGHCRRHSRKIRAYAKFGEGRNGELKHLDSESEIEEYVSDKYLSANT